MKSKSGYKREIPTCMGTGLVALDVIINNYSPSQYIIQAGGSCGNVLSILSYMNWNSYPIARLANNKASQEILTDFTKWNVNTQLISKNNTGSTPIIIHRIYKNRKGELTHKFEFKCPDSGKWLPRYKAVLAKSVKQMKLNLVNPQVFYFDRVKRSSIELAKLNKEKGAIIFFEPSAVSDIKLFIECINIADIIKFSHERIKNYNSICKDINAFLEIETFGKEGLRYRSYLNKRQWKSLKAFKFDNIVDAAGAGDWLSAGIIGKLGSHGRKFIDKYCINDIEDALYWGQALSVINCLFFGARGIMYNLKKSVLLQIAKNVLNHNSIPKEYENNHNKYKILNSNICDLF